MLLKYIYICAKFKLKNMKKITLLAALFFGAVSFSQVVINEVDSDQTSTDVTEFIELKSISPNQSLDGLIVVLYNGATDLSYDTIDLSGRTTDANGYFIIGSDAVPNVDIALGAENTIQNGADAVALYQAAASAFPNGTAVTSDFLVDAIVYGTSDDDDVELLTGLNQTVQYDEDENSMKDTESLQRKDDGTFCVTLPTLRAINNCVVLSVNQNTAESFAIFPNPATKGYVNITSLVSGAKTIAIYDVLGKQIMNTVITGDRLDISSLNSGIYIVKISQAKTSITKKLIVK